MLVSIVCTPAIAVAEAEQETTGGGVAVSVGTGELGGVFAQSIGVRYPLSSHWGLHLRTFAMHALGSDPYRFDFGGRLELLGFTLPMSGFFRVYGGGGIQIIAQLTGGGDKTVRAGLGGEVGFEAFLFPSFAFFMEMGGNGNVNDGAYGSGAMWMGGLHSYF